MLEQIATAFERKDYQTATKLLKHLLKESPENPWVQFYLGRLHEVSGIPQEAEKVYRQLLCSTTNAKILSQARQGLQRLQEIEQEERKRAIVQATIDQDVRGKLERKTQTQDYFQFYDLHLPNRGCILRFYDNGYDFQQGLEIANHASQNTIRINWNSLLSWVDKQLPQAKVMSDFTTFAQTVLEQTEMLEQIQSHIHILRRQQTSWDPAFHLYSGLVFRKNVR